MLRSGMVLVSRQPICRSPRFWRFYSPATGQYMILDRGLDSEMQREQSCRAGVQCPTLHVHRAKVSREVMSGEE